MSTTTRLEAFNRARSALDRARRESDRLRTEAIQELLQARKEVDNELQWFGYGGPNPLEALSSLAPQRNGERLSEHPKRASARRVDKPHCPFCDIDGHDGRAHRGQGDNKRKFTTSELYARGFAIPPRPESIGKELRDALAEFQGRT